MNDHHRRDTIRRKNDVPMQYYIVRPTSPHVVECVGLFNKETDAAAFVAIPENNNCAIMPLRFASWKAE